MNSKPEITGLHIIIHVLSPADKSFHILNRFRHLAGRQCAQHIFIISSIPGRPAVQDSYHTSIRFRPDGSAESLPELLLHIRNCNRLDIFPQVSILLFLRFPHRVRHSKRQPYDNQRRYHVSRKIHTLPAGTGCKQNRIFQFFKPHDLFLCVPPHLHHRIGQASTQKLVDAPHQSIRREQYQRMPMGRTGKLFDPLCDPDSFLPAPMPDLFTILWQIKQAVPLILKWGFCHIFLYPNLPFFLPPI